MFSLQCERLGFTLSCEGLCVYWCNRVRDWGLHCRVRVFGVHWSNRVRDYGLHSRVRVWVCIGLTVWGFGCALV